jgi:hypothetical protein
VDGNGYVREVSVEAMWEGGGGALVPRRKNTRNFYLRYLSERTDERTNDSEEDGRHPNPAGGLGVFLRDEDTGRPAGPGGLEVFCEMKILAPGGLEVFCEMKILAPGGLEVFCEMKTPKRSWLSCASITSLVFWKAVCGWGFVGARTGLDVNVKGYMNRWTTAQKAEVEMDQVRGSKPRRV